MQIQDLVCRRGTKQIPFPDIGFCATGSCFNREFPCLCQLGNQLRQACVLQENEKEAVSEVVQHVSQAVSEVVQHVSQAVSEVVQHVPPTNGAK
ncbi:hypothetical protein RRG08_032521 [Elysia crispata]|uniref:Uncharacterized protein n=1 Tax=Elysia crispata TaxID=231223 RepID=A0AAE1DPX5_9GAST|nr:hypothetical protein RRG08_032521 [Elysia crispata]